MYSQLNQGGQLMVRLWLLAQEALDPAGVSCTRRLTCATEQLCRISTRPFSWKLLNSDDKHILRVVARKPE
jgi:hypothetical protein